MTDTITLPRAVLEQALHALNYSSACISKQLTTKTKHDYALGLLAEANDALRAALEQPQVEQEPAIYPEEAFDMGLEAIPYYTHPQPPHQPLTDEQITQLADAHMEAFAQFVGAGEVWFEGEKEFARAIEAAHGIKEQK